MKLFDIKLEHSYVFEVYNDVPEFKVFHVTQVHGKNVVSPTQETPEADGIVIQHEQDICIAIKTADCVPIVIQGESGIALLHAGWKGLQQNIIADKKVQEIKPQQAIIGPCIHVTNYEVGKEFEQNFPNSDAFQEIEGRIYFDLIKEAGNQIQDCYNIGTNIDLAFDTFCDERLNSHRRDQTKKRNWNIIRKI